MQILKERGVYRLPDGSHVVSCAAANGIYELYSLLEWELYGSAVLKSKKELYQQYEIDNAGQILQAGSLTGWTINDLIGEDWIPHRS
jgi:hypothetical protein